MHGGSGGLSGASFREAIAHWKLNLHTQVKRSSSLPTAMFDACDPMLETRLAQTAESILACLHQPAGDLATELHPDELPIEAVAEADLRALPRRIACAEVAPLDLLDGLEAEYLGILADTCCCGEGPPQRQAVEMLRRDFGVRPGASLDQLVAELASQIDEVIDSPVADAAFVTTCQRIAAAVTLYSLAEPGEGAR
jgi:hypothetical protein